MTDTSKYTSRVTSEHISSPKFMATIDVSTAPFVDIGAVLTSIPNLFDLDTAVGQQLDIVGQWVGQSRKVILPYSVFFSFDTDNLGFGQGYWYTPYTTSINNFTLDDDHYRTLLRAVIANNNWDGTIPSAYAAWNILYANTGHQIAVQDYGDMSITYIMISDVPLNAVLQALFAGRYLTLKPIGVQINNFVVPSVSETALFAFDCDKSITLDPSNTIPSLAGFDHACWGTMYPGY